MVLLLDYLEHIGICGVPLIPLDLGKVPNGWHTHGQPDVLKSNGERRRIGKSKAWRFSPVHSGFPTDIK